MDVDSLISRSRTFADDVDKLRSPWESRTHWQVRKTFLMKNWDDFKDKDRLICLSQAWVNWRFHGNSYPEPVMDTLKEMEDGLEPTEKMLRDAEMQVIGICDHRTTMTPSVHDTSKLPHTIIPMKFVKQNSDNKLCKDSTATRDNADSKDYNNELTSDNHKEVNSLIPAKVPKLDNLPSTASNSSETSTPERPTVSLENAEFVKVKLSQAHRERLRDFVLRKRPDESALSIINSSVDFCKLSHEYSFELSGTNDPLHATCSLYINGVLVGKARADNKKTAKRAAATSALETLEKTNPTILISSNPGDLNSALSRNDIIAGPNGLDQKIADSNMGNQLLRKMGWSGQDGLGKSGSGISVPVTMTETCGRAGLGNENSDRNLISFKDAHDVIRNYASSSSTEELTFSPELSNEERAKIHKLSRRYGLRSKSYNKGEIRYLVVSRKITAADLVHQLKSSGGTKGNIQLIGPS